MLIYHFLKKQLKCISQNSVPQATMDCKFKFIAVHPYYYELHHSLFELLTANLSFKDIGHHF